MSAPTQPKAVQKDEAGCSTDKNPATWNNVLVTVASAGGEGLTNRRIATQLRADCTDVAQLTRLLFKAGLLNVRKGELANIYWIKELVVPKSSAGRLHQFHSLAEASSAQGPNSSLLFDMSALCILLHEAIQLLETEANQTTESREEAKQRLILHSTVILDEVRAWLSPVFHATKGKNA